MWKPANGALISCPLPSIRAILTCRRVRIPTASPACGPKASRRARLSILSRLRRNEPFRNVAFNHAYASRRSLAMRAAIEWGKIGIDGTPAARADLALDQNAALGKYEIR